MDIDDVTQQYTHASISGAGTRSGSGTTIHITALDGIINVNSLFTLAVFIGLAWNPNAGAGAALTTTQCLAGNKVAEDLVTFHVFAFSCFLFSSLVALCLKQAIRIAGNHNHSHHHHNHHSSIYDWAVRVNRTLLRAGIVASAVGSVFGCGFLMLALVNVVQIKLGRIGCSGAAAGAIVPLVTLVPTALLIYIAIVFHAFVSSR